MRPTLAGSRPSIGVRSCALADGQVSQCARPKQHLRRVAPSPHGAARAGPGRPRTLRKDPRRMHPSGWLRPGGGVAAPGRLRCSSQRCMSRNWFSKARPYSGREKPGERHLAALLPDRVQAFVAGPGAGLRLSSAHAGRSGGSNSGRGSALFRAPAPPWCASRSPPAPAARPAP